MWQNFIALISAHQVTSTLAASWLFSAAVSSMPAPTATTGGFYSWLFNFTHVLAGALDRYLASKGAAAVANAPQTLHLDPAQDKKP